MGSLKTFFNNIRYLARYDLKKFYVQCRYIDYALDNIRYEIENDLKNMKKVVINDAEKTLEKLVSSDCSISRFGDGEIMLAFGESIPCQNYSVEAGKKLQEVLSSNNDKLMICIPNLYQSLVNETLSRRKYDREILGHYTPEILKLLNEDKEYYSPSLSAYICTGTKGKYSEEYYERRFSKFRSIWQDKDITIVCGDRVFSYLKNNIYDNAASTEYITAPTNHAFSEYQNILNRIKKTSKNKIVILMLGPAATMLAHDLTYLGYRALDLGHLAKDYDAFVRKIEGNAKNIKAFFNPE